MHEFGGVNIHFPHGSDKAKKPNLVTVKGPKDDVAKAVARLHELATAEVCLLLIIAHSHLQTLSHNTVEVRVKREFLRFLIGRGGAERTKIQDATHARLFFPRPSAVTPVCSLLSTSFFFLILRLRTMT